MLVQKPSDGGKQCPHTFCEACVQALCGETWDAIRSAEAVFLGPNHSVLEHCNDRSYTWACPICRIMSVHLLLFIPVKRITITLLYEEEEVWCRIHLREWMFRFGDIIEMEPRIIASVQNVQGDWRIKRLAVYVVWKLLTNLSMGWIQTDDPGTRRASKILNAWIEEEGIMEMNHPERGEALLDILTRKGLSKSQWQTLGDMLKDSGCDNVPTECWKADRHRDLSSLEKLKMIQLCLDILLLELRIRHAINDAPRKLKQVDTDIKQQRRLFQTEETKNKVKRNHLTSRVSQLEAVRKDHEARETRIELETLDVEIRDARMTFEKKELEAMVAKLKAVWRFELAGKDGCGNQYWILSDVLTPQLDKLHHQDLRNSEPYWAYGVIVIGPGYTNEADKSNGWWAIHGIGALTKLAKWIVTDGRKHDYDPSQLKTALLERVRYLQALEWIAYGQGFFS
ncbi:uncharacterized protein BYT42DRAFT_623478 [Radiomyces spectabilis]|uniref:uncharacterized protein n=1 Tax=Radiomyces spectabilis TaxID=64574 RepID=UPI00221F9950|nr:uncharacterized protein BYT42DRAFT_623478 [Radiomyces spectabilis]KAI8370572.1 hypothetical protein BYT42DRAFT_623478 [Radiomyces spectabilis]